MFVSDPILYLNEAKTLFLKEFHVNISVASIRSKKTREWRKKTRVFRFRSFRVNLQYHSLLFFVDKIVDNLSYIFHLKYFQQTNLNVLSQDTTLVINTRDLMYYLRKTQNRSRNLGHLRLGAYGKVSITKILNHYKVSL